MTLRRPPVARGWICDPDLLGPNVKGLHKFSRDFVASFPVPIMGGDFLCVLGSLVDITNPRMIDTLTFALLHFCPMYGTLTGSYTFTLGAAVQTPTLRRTRPGVCSLPKG